MVMSKKEVKKIFEKIIPPSIGQRVKVNNLTSSSELILMEDAVGYYPFNGTIYGIEDTSPLLYKVEVKLKHGGLIQYLLWRTEFEVLENGKKKKT